MIIAGQARIGRDAELRHTGSTSVCNIPLAFNGGYGERKFTTWIEVSIWGKQAEGLEKHLTKGKSVVVTLRDLKQETFTKKDGTVTPKLTAQLVDLEFSAGGERTEQATPKPAPPPKPEPSPQSFEDFEDDIPF
jgi:single-strand DNA-binding protein